MFKRKPKEEPNGPLCKPGMSKPSAVSSTTTAPNKKLKYSPSSSSSSSSSARKTRGTEKRLARVRKSCPKHLADRVYRVRTQRFFMIERYRKEDELKEIFKVLGSTGNVYTVTICHVPSCDCPDAIKGNHCKHIIFIFLKVLGQNSANSTYYYQKALLSSELQDLFEHAPPSPQQAMSARVTEAYKRANGGLNEPSDAQQKRKEEVEGKSGEIVDDTTHGKRRLPSEGDSCPVCYEDFEPGQTEGLVFCSHSCGGALHKQCFQQWSAATRCTVTCVYCRAPWPNASPSTSAAFGNVVSDEGYTNLASAAGVSRQRDTSTYYHRGRWRLPRYRSIGRYR